MGAHFDHIDEEGESLLDIAYEMQSDHKTDEDKLSNNKIIQLLQSAIGLQGIPKLIPWGDKN